VVSTFAFKLNLHHYGVEHMPVPLHVSVTAILVSNNAAETEQRALQELAQRRENKFQAGAFLESYRAHPYWRSLEEGSGCHYIGSAVVGAVQVERC
jgi:hypothetical protein